MHDSITSVGVIRNQEYATFKKKDGRTPKQVYLLAVKLAPNVLKLLAEGRLITNLQSTSDYYYRCSSCVDLSYRVVGDVGAFIAPIFSSDIHLAMANALSATTPILATIRGDINDNTAGKWHSEKIAGCYLRLV